MFFDRSRKIRTWITAKIADWPTSCNVSFCSQTSYSCTILCYWANETPPRHSSLCNKFATSSSRVQSVAAFSIGRTTCRSISSMSAANCRGSSALIASTVRRKRPMFALTSAPFTSVVTFTWSTSNPMRLIVYEFYFEKVSDIGIYRFRYRLYFEFGIQIVL